jgi:hypothetical protein
MGTQRYCRVVTVAAIALLAVLCLEPPALAVPSFARRAGGVSCTMCHWHQNALNSVGKEFLRHGARIAGEEVKVESSDLKLSHYASILWTPNLSAVEDSGTRFGAGDLMLWLGGPIDSRLSALAETEFVVDEGEVEVEEIYAHYVSSLESKYYSIRAGQFQPLLLLTNASGPPRITLSRAEALSGRATNGNSFRPRDRVRGLELGTVNGPLSAYLGIGNGPGQNEEDNHMDVYATIEREIGNEGSSIGAYAYWGEAVLTSGFRDSFRRYGVIGNYTKQRTRVSGAFLFGSNDDPSGADLDNSGWFVEVAQRLRPETAAYIRFDKFDRDLASGGERTTDGPTLGISWIPSSLTRLTLEAQFLDTDGSSQNSLTAELQVAL